MKRIDMSNLLIAAVAVLLTAVVGLAQPKGLTVTVKGEVVDLWCYLEGGDRGASHKECSTTCAKVGSPIGILDAKGDLYVTAGIQDHQADREVLMDKMNRDVTVTGTLVKKGGIQMLYVKDDK